MRDWFAAVLGEATSLKAETATYAAATLVERAIALAMVPLLTRAVSPEFFGVWTQVLVSVSLLGSFVAVGLGTAGVKFLAGTGSDSFIHGWFRRLTVPVLLNAAILLAVFATFPEWSSDVVFGHPKYGIFAVELGMLVVSEAVFDMQTNLLRARQRIRAISEYTVLKSLIRLGAILAVIYGANGTLEAALAVIVALQTLLVLTIELREAPRADSSAAPHVDVADVRAFDSREALADSRMTSVDAISMASVARFALPVFGHSALVMVHVAGVRYVLAHLLNVESVGIFAVSVGLASSTVGLVFAILGFTLYPRIASAWNRGARAELRALVRNGIETYVLLAIPICALMVAAPDEVVQIIAGAEYTVNATTMALIVGGTAAFGAFQLLFYIVLTAGGIFRNLVVLIIASLVQFGGAISLIEDMGVEGAALAFFLGNATLFLGTYRQQQALIQVPVPWAMLASVVFASALMGGAASGTLGALSSWPIVSRMAVAVPVALATFAAAGAGVGLHRRLYPEHRSSWQVNAA